MSDIGADSGLALWMVDHLNGLARDPSVDLAALVTPCCEDIVLDGTQTTSRVHLVARDANGNVRIDALTTLLARQVIDFCIPRARLQEAREHMAKTGSFEEASRLQQEATDLFSSLERSGEAGELLLYMLLERMLGLPQLLCKMSLKTSSQMHVHGTDGIHARMEDDGRLALYWGESKLYANFASAVDECVKSIAPYLDATGATRQRDLLLLRDYADIEDQRLTEALSAYFLDTSPQSARVEFRGACLVGFELGDYPRHDDEALVEQIVAWRERMSKRIGDHRLDRVQMEFFCIPFPSVDAFRLGVHTALGTR